MLLALHELPDVLRAGISRQQLWPMHHESVSEEIHDAAAKAQRFHPAKALAKHNTGVWSQPDHTESEHRHTYRNTCSCKLGDKKRYTRRESGEQVRRRREQREVFEQALKLSKLRGKVVFKL